MLLLLRSLSLDLFESLLRVLTKTEHYLK
jgi:hypothetical protein